MAAAKAANAHDFIVQKPDGYDTQVGERGQTLSGGERQRISIARAILHDPRILILDEATASVDTDTEKQIQDAIARLIQGRTTFAIAHRLSTLRNADRLVVLKEGKVRGGRHARGADREEGRVPPPGRDAAGDEPDHRGRMSTPSLVEASRLVLLDPAKLRFLAHGPILRLTIEDDRSYLRVAILRAFPLSDPSRYLSVRDGQGKEIGLIAQPDALAAADRALVEHELERRYLVPCRHADRLGARAVRHRRMDDGNGSGRVPVHHTEPARERAAAGAGTDHPQRRGWQPLRHPQCRWPEPGQPGLAVQAPVNADYGGLGLITRIICHVRQRTWRPRGGQ